MTIEGVSGKTKRVGKHNFEVREDGFGTMSDEEVKIYKSKRNRYALGMLEERITALEGALNGKN